MDWTSGFNLKSEETDIGELLGLEPVTLVIKQGRDTRTSYVGN